MRTSAALGILIAACGPTGAHPQHAHSSIDPAVFLLEVGASTTEVLQRPDESVEALEQARASARGADRRRVLRDLARAHLYAAESAEGREARRHRTQAERFADAAARSSRDDQLEAEMAFVALWLSWRTESPGASARAERFTTRYAAAGELTTLAWMIRGEIAFDAEDWRGAATDFRFVLGRLGHPLYAYALYRTAQIYVRSGREDDSRQALNEVAQLGCAADADEPTLRVAALAATDLGQGTRTTSDGKRRPTSCAQNPGRGSTIDEEERPPGMK